MNEKFKIIFHFGLIAIIGALLAIIGVYSMIQPLFSCGIIILMASVVVIGVNLGNILGNIIEDRMEKTQFLSDKTTKEESQ